MKVLVTGSSGNVGSHLVKYLAGSDNEIIATTRREDKQSNSKKHLDFDCKSSYNITEGVDLIFLVRPPPMGDLENNIFPFLEYAKSKKVKTIIFLSILKPSRKTPHYHIEKKIEKLNFEHHVFLRAGFFMQNLIHPHGYEIKHMNQIFIPAGGGKTSFVDARDVAKFTAFVITNQLLQKTVYYLTGSMALTYKECAEIFTKILQRKISYVSPSRKKFTQHMIEIRNFDNNYVSLMKSHYLIIRLRLGGKVYKDYESVTGNKPTPFLTFVEDYMQMW